MVYGIVVGGHDGDPAPDQSNNVRVYFPGIHGKDVKIEHLAFSPRLMSPTKHDQQSFPGGLDPGSLVVAMKDTGSNQCQVIGLANDINQRDSRIAGNIDLLQSIQKIFTTDLQISIPPTVKEVVEGGARIRKIQEKGKNHNHDLLKGLPTNGAIYPLAGMILPQLQNIPTATQAFNQILTDSMIKNLPGAAMSLGKMFDALSGGPMKAIMKSIPKEVGYAFQSMTTLVQSVESSEGAGFSTANKVDLGTFMSNAEKLLSQATNLSDMVSAMQRLQTDTSLYGLDKLAATTMKIMTPFGEVDQILNANGMISLASSNTVMNAVSSFTDAMSSPIIFPSINVGQGIFGDSAKTMFDMFNRLSGSQMQTVIDMTNKLNTSALAKELDKMAKEVIKGGGNPLKLLKPKG